MIIRKYVLPKDLNRAKLREYMFRFFRLTKFNSQYLNIYLMIKGGVNYPLGNRVILDINNKKEVRSYVEQLAESLLANKNNLPKAKDILYIYYIETDFDSYDNYIAKISEIN